MFVDLRHHHLCRCITLQLCSGTNSSTKDPRSSEKDKQDQTNIYIVHKRVVSKIYSRMFLKNSNLDQFYVNLVMQVQVAPITEKRERINREYYMRIIQTFVMKYIHHYYINARFKYFYTFFFLIESWTHSSASFIILRIPPSLVFYSIFLTFAYKRDSTPIFDLIRLLSLILSAIVTTGDLVVDLGWGGTQ